MLEDVAVEKKRTAKPYLGLIRGTLNGKKVCADSNLT